MGLYVWIALGCAVGLIARLLTPRRTNIDWLESVLMGIAGGVVGGWIGSRIWGNSGIDYLGWPAMVGAVIAAAVLTTVYIAPKRRRNARPVELTSSDNTFHDRAA